MGSQKGRPFSEKHGTGEIPDTSVKDEILKQAKKNELSCAAAFEIAKDLRVSVETVGRTVDLLNVKLIKCQLGLFGYQPKKKIVMPEKRVEKDLEDAIAGALVGGRLPCQSAWNLAVRFKVSKMSVSSASEALGIKIKPCQLGAF